MLATSSVAGAQIVDGQWRLGTQSGHGTAVERPPQPTVIVVQPSPIVYPGQTVFPRQPVYSTLVPAVVMNDGSIYADFGYGYEPVMRGCQVVTTFQPGQPKVFASNGVVIPSAAQVPSALPPVPNQLESQRRQVTLSAPAQSSCYSRDASGRVFVYRR